MCELRVGERGGEAYNRESEYFLFVGGAGGCGGASGLSACVSELGVTRLRVSEVRKS